MALMWTGCGTALVTPFTTHDAIDERALRGLVRRQLAAGIDFLCPCGTTGESPTLSRDERRRVVDIVIEEVGGRVPVLAGAGGYDTRAVIEEARAMERAGASGLLSVTPYYNKPTQAGLIAHYRAIAGATSLPIIIYNVPGRTGCNVAPETVATLATEPGIAGVKEASGNIVQISEICRMVPADFSVLSGDDAVTLPLIAVGGRGVISVAANEMPAEMTALVRAALDGRFADARRLNERLLPLLLANFVETNPIPVKHVLARLGLIEERYRLPLVPPSEATRRHLERVMEMVGLREPMAHAAVM